jgi:hypothetical protein
VPCQPVTSVKLPVNLPTPPLHGCVVLGIILSLGALFLLLAAYRILPQGINAISELGVWNLVIGYGSLSLGLVASVIAGVQKYSSPSPLPPPMEPTMQNPIQTADLAPNPPTEFEQVSPIYTQPPPPLFTISNSPQNPHLPEGQFADVNSLIIKSMAFYYIHRLSYEKAIQELMFFLCHVPVEDLLRNIEHILSHVKKCSAPRFDKFSLYNEGDFYKINLVHDKPLQPLTLTQENVYAAQLVCVQAFPYHYAAILEVGEKLFALPLKQIRPLQEACRNSAHLYDVLIGQSLVHDIQYPHCLRTLTPKLCREIKQQIGAWLEYPERPRSFLKDKFNDCLKGDRKTTIELFKNGLFPLMLAALEKELKICFANCQQKQPSTQEERIASRALFIPFTALLVSSFEADQDVRILVNQIFQKTDSTFFVFAAILGELAYHKAIVYFAPQVYEGNDILLI